jgi:dihydrofolate synthase/folylpolyglutamate synthase
MKISSFQEAIRYLDSFVPPTSSWGEPSFAHKRGIYLMELLGNPQNKLKVIHIAGTSGKGSTAYMTSAALSSQGYKVGLTVSPHILHLLERIQIANHMISEELFCAYLQEIVPSLEKMKQSEYGQPTFFEIMVALAYHIFYKVKVDVAVIETGLGGRWDATNTVIREDKIAVLTRIGFDHMEYLGNTLTSIATEKSKIIHRKNHVITIAQEQEVMDVFQKEADANQSQFTVISQDKYKLKSISEGHIHLRYSCNNNSLEDISISLNGSYQAENAALALTASLTFIEQIGDTINNVRLQNSLSDITIPGRMEQIEWNNQQYILDGAHNPQKMHAFVHSLIRIFPDKKFIFVISLKKGKEYDAILKEVVPYAEKIVITEFKNDTQGWKTESEKAEVLSKIIEDLGFHDIIIEKNAKKAIHQVSQYTPVVITGSFYLLGEVEQLLY